MKWAFSCVMAFGLGSSDEWGNVNLEYPLPYGRGSVYNNAYGFSFKPLDVGGLAMAHLPSKGFSGPQLARIHGNRQGRRQALPLGDVLARTAPDSSADNHQARRVFEAISDVVDDAFRRECQFDDFRGGEVILLVKQRQVLYHIKMLWHARLMAHLQRALPRRVRRITFKTVDPDRPGGAAFIARGM